MDAPASLRDTIERIALAGLGAASLTADRAEEIVDALADRGIARREDVREVLDDLRARWRDDTARLGEKAGDGLQGALSALGIGGLGSDGAAGSAREARLEELELRVAQLEHRLRLVEGTDPQA